MSTMTSLCVKCSNTTMLIFFKRLLLKARCAADSLVFLALRMIHRHPLSLLLLTSKVTRCSNLPSRPNTRDPKLPPRHPQADSQVRRLQLSRRETLRPVQEKRSTARPSARSQRGRSTRRRARPRRGWPATEAELRTLHKGMDLLNMCIQRFGAGDEPTSVCGGVPVARSSVLITSNHRFMRKQLKFCYFLEISWFASFSILEGGLPSRTQLAALQGVFTSRGGVGGGGLQRGGNAAEDF